MNKKRYYINPTRLSDLGLLPRLIELIRKRSENQSALSTKKTLLIIAGLALLVGCVLVLRLRREKHVALSAAQTAGGLWFEVRVERPIFNGARAPWELPGVILGTRERGPRLNQDSSGVRIRNVTAHRLELSADDGWDLLIETDATGRLTAETHVAFPIELGTRPLKFNCRPANPSVGYLTTTQRDSGEIDGSFALELTTCINAQSGKTAQWPYDPLPVRGNFAGLKRQG